MRANILRVGAALLVAAGAVGCGSAYNMNSGAAAPAQCSAATATPVTGAIEIATSAFVPTCAKVAKGTAVTFTNNDVIAHTVTSDAGQVDNFDSGLMAHGVQFQHTFGTVGTIGIHCTVHPFMTLTVIVQ
jgi:plastocyanin